MFITRVHAHSQVTYTLYMHKSPHSHKHINLRKPGDIPYPPGRCENLTLLISNLNWDNQCILSITDCFIRVTVCFIRVTVCFIRVTVLAALSFAVVWKIQNQNSLAPAAGYIPAHFCTSKHSFEEGLVTYRKPFLGYLVLTGEANILFWFVWL